MHQEDFSDIILKHLKELEHNMREEKVRNLFKGTSRVGELNNTTQNDLGYGYNNTEVNSVMEQRDMFGRRKDSEEIKMGEDKIDERESEYYDTKNLKDVIKEINESREKNSDKKNPRIMGLDERALSEISNAHYTTNLDAAKLKNLETYLSVEKN